MLLVSHRVFEMKLKWHSKCNWNDCYLIWRLFKREEFEVVREMAIKAREENELLKEKVKSLELMLTKHDKITDDVKIKRTNSKKIKN